MLECTGLKWEVEGVVSFDCLAQIKLGISIVSAGKEQSRAAILTGIYILSMCWDSLNNYLLCQICGTEQAFCNESESLFSWKCCFDEHKGGEFLIVLRPHLGIYDIIHEPSKDINLKLSRLWPKCLGPSTHTGDLGKATGPWLKSHQPWPLQLSGGNEPIEGSSLSPPNHWLHNSDFPANK